uniref:ATP synthase F0 subunit 6 n=1 Tax=Zanna robusticephalica TaxID=3081104 RepID=UPI002A7FB91C|nr:ATP synthase F0 subunit 6 [Zanna robusticephalica]WOW98857.1 ATP synthase F0 subunit 6 [Zanna robusticephalica]
MMNSLFMSFDPMTKLTQMNWITMLIPIIFLPKMFWMSHSRSIKLKKMIEKKLINEFKSITNHKDMLILSSSMFTTILIMNMMGLFPYIFTTTSHISLAMSLSMPTWIMLMLYGWTNHTNKMFLHLLPSGTPTTISPMMILIETTGNLIRPISLSVRLTANMIAGHLLMTLLGQTTNMDILIMNLPLQMILTLFESAVSFIQAYVFSTLITLYSSELP